MSKKKKSAKEASNTFHNIMKASVSNNPNQNYPQVEKCPSCSLYGDFIPPPKVNGRKLILTFKCPNEHLFTKEIDLM